MLITASDFEHTQDLSDAGLINWTPFKYTQGYWYRDDDGMVWIKSYGSVIACFDKRGNIIPHEYFATVDRAHIEVLHREYYRYHHKEIPMRSIIEKCLDIIVSVMLFMIGTLAVMLIIIWLARATL